MAKPAATARSEISSAVAPAERPPPSREGQRTGARAKRSAERRDAILSAALEEFSARGFAATRLDDVARRAGVAKGTIYLHFPDKETLFQELIRAELSPVVGALEHASNADVPMRVFAEQMIEMFAREVYGTHRKDVIRLVLSEGSGFPTLAEFYYREVVSRVMEAIRGMLQACARAWRDRRSDALVRFPQLLAAPGLIAILWNGLFERFEPLDVRAMMRAHFELVLRLGDVRHERAAHATVLLAALALAACSNATDRRLPGLGRGRSHLRQPGRDRPHRDAVGARGRHGRSRRAPVHPRSTTCSRPMSRGEGLGDERAAGVRARADAAQDRRRHAAELDDAEADAAHRRGAAQFGADAARAPPRVRARSSARCSRSISAPARSSPPAGRCFRCCRPATSSSASSCRRRSCREIALGDVVTYPLRRLQRASSPRASASSRARPNITPPVIYSLEERSKLVFLIEARAGQPERPARRSAGQRALGRGRRARREMNARRRHRDRRPRPDQVLRRPRRWCATCRCR